MPAFKNCLLSSGLSDIQSHGCEFTWTKKKSLATLVWSKLDRAILNDAWMHSFPASTAAFMPAGISDHSPIVVTIYNGSTKVAEELKPKIMI